MRKSKSAALAAIVVMILLSLTACDNAAVTGEYFDVFGTTLYIESADDGYAESVADVMRDAELLLSATVEGSDVYRLNAAHAGESVQVSPLTMTLLVKAREVYLLTDGAYDPSVYPLVELWGFSPDVFVPGEAPDSVPTDEEIAAALALVGFDRAFELDEEALTVTKLIEGAKLDLGGIAKGYEVQQALAAATGETLVNLGGNIGGVGREFNIGIGAPRPYSLSYVGTVALHGGECISTSGDYERYYEIDGVRYHHVIDPHTGRPAASGLASATVITTDGALGDALATAILVAGEEQGRVWIKELSGHLTGISCVTVTPDLDVASCGREFKSAQ